MGNEADLFADLLPEGHVPVVKPDGSLSSVSPDQYGAAIGEGARLQSREEQEKFRGTLKYGEHGIAAGLAGAARGVTLGASDVLLPQSGLVERETLAGLKEHNEGASVAGEIAGTVGSLLVPGEAEVSGPALAAKLGSAVTGGLARVGAGLGERIAVKAASGAAEGLLYGAGQAVSEAALGDAPLNAEKFIATTGLGGLLGGAGGGVGELIGSGVRAGLQRAMKVNVADAVEGFADDAAIRSTGATKADVTKLSDAQKKNVATTLRGMKVNEGGVDVPIMGATDTAEDILRKTRLARDEVGDKIGSFYRDADTGSGGGNFDYHKLLGRVQSEVFDKADPIERQYLQAAVGKEIDAIGSEAAKGGGSFELAHKMRRTIDKTINFQSEAVSTELKQSLRAVFAEELKDQGEGILGKVAREELEAANKQFSALASIEDMSEHGANRMQGNNRASLRDHLVGLGAGATVGGLPGIALGLAGAAGNKVLRERGNAFLARSLSTIADHPALATIAKSFQKSIQGSLAAGPGLLGHYGPALANAAAQGPAETLMTHLHLAQTDPKYRETMALAGFPQEDDERHGALEQKALALHSMGQALEAHDKTMSNAVDRMVRGGPAPALSASTLARQDFGSKRQAKDDVNAHRTHADDITKLAADPAALADRVARNLQGVGEHAPATAAAMSATASRAVQFLSQKLARPPPGGPLAPKWHQSATEIASFGRYLHAVQDPMSVVKAAASGAIDPAGLEVLKNVYPSLMADLQKRVASKMAEQPKGVPYSRKVTLSLLSGIDADGTVNGQSIAHAQAVFRKAPEQQSQQHQPSPARADKLTVASRSELPTQAGVHRE